VAKHYYIGLSRKEIARVSYFPALEIKNQPDAEWIDAVLIPLLLPIARRKNKRIQEIPITFWAFTRHTARQYREELFLCMTPANPGAIAMQAVEKALRKIRSGVVFAGLELIQEYAFPICQIFRRKLIRFYCSVTEVEEYMEYLANAVPASLRLYCDAEDARRHYLPAFRWEAGAPTFTLSEIDRCTTMLVNRDSEILFMRANINTIMNGEYFRKFQQALNCIGIEE